MDCVNVIVLMGCVVTIASAQDSSDIATDRPAVTDSSAVVPHGMLQVENGVLDMPVPGTEPKPYRHTPFR